MADSRKLLSLNWIIFSLRKHNTTPKPRWPWHKQVPQITRTS